MTSNYLIWKWRALAKQRVLTFPFLQFLLGFFWINHGYTFPISYIKMISFVFFIAHVFLLPLSMFQWGRDMLNDSQGIRFCVYSAFSFVCALIVNVNELYDPLGYGQGDHHEDESGSKEVFAVMSVFAMSAFQRMGLDKDITVILHVVCFVLWIVVIHTQEFNPVASMAILILFVFIAIRVSLQEMEYIQTYNELSEINSTGTMGRFSEDVVTYLMNMERCIYSQYSLLEANALHFKDSGGWSDLVGCVLENAQLCRALNFAAIHRQTSELNDSSNSQYFSFYTLCCDVFEVFEARCGSALTLYLDNSAASLFIKANRDPFESMIFSLLYDCVHSPKKAICYIRLDSIGDNWKLTLEVTQLLKKSWLPEFQDKQSVVAKRASFKLLKKKPTGTNNGGSNKPLIQQSQLRSMANWNLFDKTVVVKTTSLDRVARCIAVKFFQSEIDFSDTEYKSGLAVRKKFMMINPDSSDIKVIRRKHAINKYRFKYDWILLRNDAHDMDGYNSLKEKFLTIAVPLGLELLDDLVTGLAKNPNYTDRYQGVFVQDSQVLGMLPQLKMMPSLAKKLIVVCDSEKQDPSDYEINHQLTVATCIFVKVSTEDLFATVLNIVHSLSPRGFAVMPVFDTEEDQCDWSTSTSSNTQCMAARSLSQVKRVHRATDIVTLNSWSKTSTTFHNLKDNRMYRIKKIERWIVLIKQFKPAISSEILVDILNVRLEKLSENVRDPIRDSFKMPKVTAMNIRSGSVLNGFSHVRRKVRCITTLYLPVISWLKQCLQAMDFEAMQKLSSRYTVKSSNIGLLHLSSCFLILQEVLSVTMDILENGLQNKVKYKDLDNTERLEKNKSYSVSFLSLGEAKEGFHDIDTEKDLLLNIGSMSPFFNDDPDAEPLLMDKNIVRRAELKALHYCASHLEGAKIIIGIIGVNVVNTIDEMIDTIEMAMWESAYEN